MATLDPDSPFGRLAHHLSALTDPRQARRPVHLLDELLLMSLGTFFTGGRTFVDMEHFAHGHEGWLRTFMELPGGLPSHDTFGRLFAALDARQLEDALRQWCASVEIALEPAGLPPPALRHLALDGKTLRGSRSAPGPDNTAGTRARAVLNLWLAGRGLTLAQRRIPDDGSEIDQAPLLLRHLQLQGAVITADAAHAQSATATQIIRQGGDYVLCVKGNQPGTQQAVREHLAPLMAAASQGHCYTADKAHGRLEERRCWLCTDLTDFAPRGQWSGLGAIAIVETRCENLGTGAVSTEQRCFITSLLPRPGQTTEAFAALLAGLVRAHWEIENSLHWRLDVIMGEDACRARCGEAPANLAVLRKIALNTLKLHPPLPGKKGAAMSIRSRQYLASISPNYLASLLKTPSLAN